MSLRKKAVVALIIANIIWGAASPIFKWSLENIGIFTLAFLRFSLGSLLLFPFVYKTLHIEKKDIFSVVGIGFFGVGLNIIFFFLGLKLTESINAPMIAASGPIILIILSVILLKEKVKRNVPWGTAISLLGVLIIIFQPLLEKGLDGNLLGNFYLFIATVSGVIHALISKKVLKKYQPLPITFWSFVVGSLIFLPFFLQEMQTGDFLTTINYKGITGIVFGVIFSSVIAYSLYEWAVKHIQANETGVFTYIDPVVAIIIAVPLLHETITPIYICGSLLVFIGIFSAENKIHIHPLYLLFRNRLKNMV